MRSKVFYASFLALLLCLVTMTPVWAQETTPTTLGAVFCNVFLNTEPFGQLFSYLAYGAGVFFILNGVHHFRKHTDSPQNHPMHGPFLAWIGGTCLLVMPSIAGTLINTLYTPAGGGIKTCASPGSVAGGQTLDLMLSGLVGNIKGPLVSLVSVIAIISGIWMIVHGLMKASRHGFDARSHSIHSISANLIFGALLMTIGDNLGMMMMSVFNTKTAESITGSTVTAWGFVTALAGGGSAQFGNAVAAALTFFQLVGIIAFVRGWLIMKKVVEGGGNVTMGQGITHILGGVLAINIAVFLKIMDTTFGTNLM